MPNNRSDSARANAQISSHDTERFILASIVDHQMFLWAMRSYTANGRRQVVALAGDGGLTMLFGDLVTLEQNRLPVKVIVFENSSLGFVELEMKAAGIVNFGTDLAAVDFAAVARAVGLSAHRAEQPADHHRRAGKGVLAVRNPNHLAGRGDELLDLVSTNVARRILD